MAPQVALDRERELTALDPEQAITYACERSFRVFVEEAWRVVVPAAPFRSNWHVDAVSEHLQALYEGKIDDLLINIPPRFGKSTICAVLFPAWVWVKDPASWLIFASYSQKFATRDSLKTRTLVTSPGICPGGARRSG